MKGRLVSLDRIATGSFCTARELHGGAEFLGRLAGMGVTIGTRIEVLQNVGHGPLLVLARDIRIALSRGEAAKILVEESDGLRESP